MTNKKILFLLLIFCTIHIFSQQKVSIEKNLINAEIGVLGAYLNVEYKINNYIAIVPEIGLDSEIFGGSYYKKTGFKLLPVISLEPKWYYNLGKRNNLDKKISNNNANYLSFKTSFNPNWFAISNFNNITTINQLTLLSNWGIRRNITKNLNYDIAIGSGFRYLLLKKVGYDNNKIKLIINLKLRIGINLNK